MNYFEYEQFFWKMDEMENFTPVETRIYFYLLSLANRNFWQGDIVIGDLRLAALLGLSPNTFKRGRDVLQRRGVIDHSRGKRGHSCAGSYRLVYHGKSQPNNPSNNPSNDPSYGSYNHQSNNQHNGQNMTPLYSNKQKQKYKTYYGCNDDRYSQVQPARVVYEDL